LTHDLDMSGLGKLLGQRADHESAQALSAPLRRVASVTQGLEQKGKASRQECL